MHASLDLLAVLFMHYTVFTYFVPLFDLIQFTLHTRYLTYFIFVYRPCPFTINLSGLTPVQCMSKIIHLTPRMHWASKGTLVNTQL